MDRLSGFEDLLHIRPAQRTGRHPLNRVVRRDGFPQVRDQLQEEIGIVVRNVVQDLLSSAQKDHGGVVPDLLDDVDALIKDLLDGCPIPGIEVVAQAKVLPNGDARFVA